MPAPYDPKLTRVRVSTTSGGTYSIIGYTRSFDMTEGTDGDTTLRWFGGDATKAGAATLTGTIPVFFDRADTTGQQILISAKRNGTKVWLQIGWEGVASGAVVDQFQASITEFSRTSDSEGDAVEGSFSFTGAPSTLTTVTLV